MKAILITPTTVEQIEVNGKLESLTKAVGGHIEMLSISDSLHAYINEEGKLKGLPENPIATRLCKVFNVGLASDDYIVGNMIILGSLSEDGEHDGDEHDISEQDYQQIVAFLMRECQF